MKQEKHSATSDRGAGNWLAGAVFGAVAMYYLDPHHGRRRRALARDQVNSTLIHASHALDAASRDFNNRLDGLSAQLKRLPQRLRRRRQPVDTRALLETVHAKLGRIVSHPHAITVSGQEGVVVLQGPILAREKPALLMRIRALPGVCEVEDQLQAHESAEGVAALQGPARQRQRFALLRQNWPPALRGMALMGAGMFGLSRLVRHTSAGMLLTLGGLALAARSAQQGSPPGKSDDAQAAPKLDREKTGEQSLAESSAPDARTGAAVPQQLLH